MLSEFRQGEEPGCTNKVLWLRDNVYAQGQLVSSRLNGAMRTPALEFGTNCDFNVFLRVANPSVNQCRIRGVYLFRRPATGSYDYSSPVSPTPVTDLCPVLGSFNDTVPSYGTWCYVAKAIHWSGNPVSAGEALLLGETADTVADGGDGYDIASSAARDLGRIGHIVLTVAGAGESIAGAQGAAQYGRMGKSELAAAIKGKESPLWSWFGRGSEGAEKGAQAAVWKQWKGLGVSRDTLENYQAMATGIDNKVQSLRGLAINIQRMMRDFGLSMVGAQATAEAGRERRK